VKPIAEKHARASITWVLLASDYIPTPLRAAVNAGCASTFPRMSGMPPWLSAPSCPPTRAPR
jgi:hypothetical protein